MYNYDNPGNCEQLTIQCIGQIYFLFARETQELQPLKTAAQLLQKTILNVLNSYQI